VAQALDGYQLATLNDFDMVYPWGVLHHTGKVLVAAFGSSVQ
jgi:hypothetical protein